MPLVYLVVKKTTKSQAGDYQNIERVKCVAIYWDNRTFDPGYFYYLDQCSWGALGAHADEHGP